ncbi:MAG: ArsR/SmtB family transcription factor [Burkholderiaceae bacterium]
MLWKHVLESLAFLLYFHDTRNMNTSKTVAILGALAQETRLDIFRLLVRAGDRGVAAGAIAKKLGVPAATCSFHLKELKAGQVITCQRDGRSLIYRADFATMQQLLAYLIKNCCQGDHNLNEKV